VTASRELLELHRRLETAIASYMAARQNCKCSEHLAALVMEVIRQERHNPYRQGIVFAAQVFRRAILRTAKRHVIKQTPWPDTLTAYHNMALLARALKRRAEVGRALDDIEPEARYLTTPSAPPHNPRATPPTEGTTA
jgi:hypothetical protein